jgi:IQ calmodulin-binding motif
MRFRRTSTANTSHRDAGESSEQNKAESASTQQYVLQTSFLKDYPPHYFACLPPPEMFEKVKQTERIIFQEHHYKDYLRRIEMAERAVVKIQCAYRTYLARKYMKELRTDLLLR